MILYEHAQKIVDADEPQIGLFLGTGSTKTRIALFLARGKTLIVAPKTQVQDKNWERELAKIQQEDPSFKRDITVISKETFRRDYKVWAITKWKTFIGDEAHTLLGASADERWVKINGKSSSVLYKSQTFEALIEFLRIVKPERIYPLTATLAKTPMTVWAASEMLGYGWDPYEFRKTFYFRLPKPGRDIWIAKTDRETKKRLAEAIKTLGYVGQLSDYFDVPDQMYKTIFVENTAQQKIAIKEAQINYPDAMAFIEKHLQIQNGVFVGDKFTATRTFKNEKLETLKDLSFEFPQMVVFCKYTAQIEMYKKELSKTRKVLVLDGKTKDQGAVIFEANASDSYVLLAQSQISAGWELPKCPVMVFVSGGRYVYRVQGEGRILRANLLKKNLYIDLVTKGGPDENSYKRMKEGKDFDQMLYAKENGLL